MSGAEMKAVIRQRLAELNRGDLEAYLALYADDADKLHFVAPQLPPTKEGVRLFYAAFQAAFPDMHVEADRMLAEDDCVTVLFRVSGTHKGDFMGAPPTHRRFEIEGITILRLRDGQCVERWNQLDQLGMMQQLGLMPSA